MTMSTVQWRFCAARLACMDDLWTCPELRELFEAALIAQAEEVPDEPVASDWVLVATIVI